MTHKYKRQCWNCGSQDLMPDTRGVRCRSCGATWNDLPEGGSLPITIVDSKTGKAPRSGKLTEARPSGTVQRRAARTRGKT